MTTSYRSSNLSRCNGYGQDFSSFSKASLTDAFHRETDVQQLNEQNEYLKIVSSQYRKIELQVETYQSVVGKMEEDTK